MTKKKKKKKKTEKKKRYLAAILKQHDILCFPELSFLIVHKYMVQISLQNSGRKVVFLGGSMQPPWASSGSKSTLVT